MSAKSSEKYLLKDKNYLNLEFILDSGENDHDPCTIVYYINDIKNVESIKNKIDQNIDDPKKHVVLVVDFENKEKDEVQSLMNETQIDV